MQFIHILDFVMSQDWFELIQMFVSVIIPKYPQSSLDLQGFLSYVGLQTLLMGFLCRYQQVFLTKSLVLLFNRPHTS